jgi:hypothetical protein
LAADWLVSVEMAAPTHTHTRTPLTVSPPTLSLSLPLRELLHSDSSSYLPFRLKPIFVQVFFFDKFLNPG